MRRLLASFVALTLAGVALGCCHHVAGKCDCDMDGPCCGYGTVHEGLNTSAPASAPTPVLNAEPIKEMPKEKK